MRRVLFTAALLASFSTTLAPARSAVVVTSPAFRAGARIPLRFAATLCGGQNLSIPLRWRGLPPFTRSIALSIFDPDARSGTGFWHWIVYDIPSSTMHLNSSVGGTNLPAGSEVGKNDASTKAYFGPCPPRGELHHYRITVYALGTGFVQAKRDRGARVIVDRFSPSILASGTLVGTYLR